MCLLDRNSLCLGTEDVEKMNSAVALLKPFEAATRETSADQYFTISKLIPIARSLQQLTAEHITLHEITQNSNNGYEC